jgi:hypothetical protein
MTKTSISYLKDLDKPIQFCLKLEGSHGGFHIISQLRNK